MTDLESIWNRIVCVTVFSIILIDSLIWIQSLPKDRNTFKPISSPIPWNLSEINNKQLVSRSRTSHWSLLFRFQLEKTYFRSLQFRNSRNPEENSIIPRSSFLMNFEFIQLIQHIYAVTHLFCCLVILSLVQAPWNKSAMKLSSTQIWRKIKERKYNFSRDFSFLSLSRQFRSLLNLAHWVGRFCHVYIDSIEE